MAKTENGLGGGSESLLVEIGTEELPASFVSSGLDALPGIVSERLGEARIGYSDIQVLGTPRRLSFYVHGLSERQADRSEVVTGPPKSVAYDEEGQLTKAALGFAKKNGVGPEALEVVETEKGAYLAAKTFEAGRSAKEVLPEVLASVCAAIPFRKSMRWGSGDMAFGRPVQWLLALLGEERIAFDFAGVSSGDYTYGHRFLAPERLRVKSPDAYPELLKEASVMVNVAERRTALLEALHAEANRLGGVVQEDAFLLSECLNLVEWPFVLPGAFDERFLALPDGVVVSVMRDHQRYFAVRDSQGKLLPRYLNVVNTAEAPSVIVAGNDRVLKARLEDARFFLEEDRKQSLDTFAEKLAQVVFHARLGTVREKSERLASLVEVVLAKNAQEAAPKAAEAARLCKADLCTLMVGEFPELQGEVGQYYGELEGRDKDVCLAIRDHYRPAGAADSVPEHPVAAALSVADRIDSLVGCFGIGLEPSGSADPFALRRAMLGIIRIALEGPLDVNVAELTRAAHALHIETQESLEAKASQEGGKSKKKKKAFKTVDELLERLDAFYRGRLRVYLSEDGEKNNAVDACLEAWDGTSLRDLERRIVALNAFRKKPEFAKLETSFKRCHNIAKGVEPGVVNKELLREDAEKELAEKAEAVYGAVAEATRSGAYEKALGVIVSELGAPIDYFFEEVFVMAEDEAVKANRLRLLSNISSMLSGIAAFEKL